MKRTTLHPIPPFRWLMLFAFFGLCACSKDMLEHEALVGTYTVKYSHGEEILELRSDATYTQNYIGRENISFENTGHWSLLEKSSVLALHDALLFTDFRGDHLNAPKRSGRGLRIRRIFGAIDLVIDSDAALIFKKQQSKGDAKDRSKDAK